MGQSELLAFAAAVLERLRLEYFVTGSSATIFYGEPRLTNDIDIVVCLSLDRVDAFCGEFHASEFYVSLEAARSAAASGGQFNVIHPSSGLKIDFIIPTRSEFDLSRLRRSRRVSPSPGVEVMFASPEDVIVKKLDYFREGGSEKHLRDIAGVVDIMGDQLDRAYIEHWTEKMGLRQIWDAVLRRLNQE